MRFQGKKYFINASDNLSTYFPIFSLTIGGIYALSTDENDEPNLYITVNDVLGIIFLWVEVFQYLMIWDDLIYLTRMLKEVIADMQVFLMMFLISQFAFA